MAVNPINLIKSPQIKVQTISLLFKSRLSAGKKHAIYDPSHREIKSGLLTFMQNQAYVTTKPSIPGICQRPENGK